MSGIFLFKVVLLLTTLVLSLFMVIAIIVDVIKINYKSSIPYDEKSLPDGLKNIKIGKNVYHCITYCRKDMFTTTTYRTIRYKDGTNWKDICSVEQLPLFKRYICYIKVTHAIKGYYRNRKKLEKNCIKDTLKDKW